MFGRDPAPSQISAHNIGPGLRRKVCEQTLTSREVEVLQLVAGGNSNKLIARALTISHETAKTHVKNILEKLDAHDRTHAVTLGLRRGILQL